MEKNEIIALLERHSVKPTANRIIIARALADAGRPVSMGELEDAIGSIDKSNISRALAAFKEASMLHVLEDGSESVRYELCLSEHHGHDTDEHVHFYCERCGKTFCLTDIAIPGVSLPDGWHPEHVNYMIKGVCPSCAR